MNDEPLRGRLTNLDKAFILSLKECKTREEVIGLFFHPNMTKVHNEVGSLRTRVNQLVRSRDELDLNITALESRASAIERTIDAARKYVGDSNVENIIVPPDVLAAASYVEPPSQQGPPASDV